MSTMNMNGNDNDTSYRYKMPIFKVTVAGKGNGIYTIFNNIDDISKSLNHPSEVIMKYLASVSGSSYIQARETITGHHTPIELKEFIMEYNKYLVFCYKCNIPETIPSLSGNKKNPKLEFCCSACKNTTEAISNNKRINKGIDIIIKYLKAGGEWKIYKGTCVKQSVSNEFEESEKLYEESTDQIHTDNLVQISAEEEANPFDFI
jgi:translation initiation factor 2 beta subunit (eIF-2beta)/eIF-5